MFVPPCVIHQTWSMISIQLIENILSNARWEWLDWLVKSPLVFNFILLKSQQEVQDIVDATQDGMNVQRDGILSLHADEQEHSATFMQEWIQTNVSEISKQLEFIKIMGMMNEQLASWVSCRFYSISALKNTQKDQTVANQSRKQEFESKKAEILNKITLFQQLNEESRQVQTKFMQEKQVEFFKSHLVKKCKTKATMKT